MKIKAFLTDKSVHMQSVPVFATDETMPGALKLTPTGKEFDDFSGFGVCLTGGSCYLLEKADEATRKKLIENLFSTKETTEEEARLLLKTAVTEPFARMKVFTDSASTWDGYASVRTTTRRSFIVTKIRTAIFPSKKTGHTLSLQ